MNIRLAALLVLVLASPMTSASSRLQLQIAAIEHSSDQRRLGEAEAALLRLRADPEAQTPQAQARIALEAARVELRRGQYLLAEQHMLEWNQRYSKQVGEALRVRAHIVLAQARFEQNQLAQAANQLEALLTSPAMDQASLRAEVNNALGAVQIYAGEYAQALQTLGAALADADVTELPLLRSQILCWIGLVHLYRGELDAAQTYYAQGLQLRQLHAPGSVSEAVAVFFLGIVARGQGEFAASRALLDRAMHLLDAERLRQSTWADTRVQWAAQFAFIYRGAIVDAVYGGDLPRAFALLQRHRGAEQALAQPLDPQATVAAGQAGLASDEAVLAFVTHQNQNHALLLTATALHSYRIDLDEAGLREAVDALAMLIAARSAADADALLTRSHALYQQLIAPALALAPATTRLLLQPDGPLHELPFAALVSARTPTPRYLVEDQVLSRLISLPQRPQRGTGLPVKPLWAIADPDLQGASSSSWLRDGGRGRLPGAAAEARAVERLYAPTAGVLIADAATEAAVKALPADADLHFATHMVRDSLDEQHSFLALGEGAGEDGQLSAAEILTHLVGPRELVVLSGCASQRGALAGGAGALSLARAWHQAGARQVLATQWPVPDRATAEVMVLFHTQRHRLGGDPGLALALAQRAWLQSTRAPAISTQIARWWHREQSSELVLPFYWAAMVVSE